MARRNSKRVPNDRGLVNPSHTNDAGTTNAVSSDRHNLAERNAIYAVGDCWVVAGHVSNVYRLSHGAIYKNTDPAEARPMGFRNTPSNRPRMM